MRQIENSSTVAKQISTLPTAYPGKSKDNEMGIEMWESPYLILNSFWPEYKHTCSSNTGMVGMLVALADKYRKKNSQDVRSALITFSHTWNRSNKLHNIQSLKHFVLVHYHVYIPLC